MTNEWGSPITGEEMKALKGRIDPDVLVELWGYVAPYGDRVYGHSHELYHLPANHPYYKVREYNQKHGTNLVLHDNSEGQPEDWDGCLVLFRCGGVSYGQEWSWLNDGDEHPLDIIAYTPKPKESEVTEEMPRDEAIEYVLRECGYEVISVDRVKEDPIDYRGEILAARLIQQYEPKRLKPAVDVAAEEYAGSAEMNYWVYDVSEAFKAGAAWQKENGNG